MQKKMKERNRNWTVAEICRDFLLRPDVHTVYPNLCTIMLIYLAFIGGTACVERGVSCLKAIVTPRRVKLGQEKKEQLFLISQTASNSAEETEMVEQSVELFFNMQRRRVDGSAVEGSRQHQRAKNAIAYKWGAVYTPVEGEDDVFVAAADAAKRICTGVSAAAASAAGGNSSSSSNNSSNSSNSNSVKKKVIKVSQAPIETRKEREARAVRWIVEGYNSITGFKASTSMKSRMNSKQIRRCPTCLIWILAARSGDANRPRAPQMSPSQQQS